ncbi:16520_t:CDS:2 [Funneliformis caledonium]|uniref:16520_t:CDS:1 n=1 Tax=Funneliformis caledonium TaxID=1117310 RepID=A0A9N9FSH6_9GLOM|nr:16520_t:CDS:2 [Funneliformis caledonium]
MLHKDYDTQNLSVKLQGCDIPYHEPQEFNNFSIIGSGSYASLEILDGKREKPISTTNGRFVKLYQRCWKHEPDERPNIDQVISELNSIDPKSHFDSKEYEDNEIIDELENEDDLSGCDVQLYI